MARSTQSWREASPFGTALLVDDRRRRPNLSLSCQHSAACLMLYSALGSSEQSMGAEGLRCLARLGLAIAQARARSGDAAMISEYMGRAEPSTNPLGEVALEYADQNERDYRAFTKAVREGRLEAVMEV